jgi:hypothetical protein
MNFVEEDFFAGMARLRREIGSVDLRTVEILACHIAIEKEIDLALLALLPRGEQLRGLGFGQKVSVLQASCHLTDIDRYARPLLAFNELRNTVAHGEKRKITSAFRSFCGSFDGTKLEEKHVTVPGLATALMRMLTLIVKEEGYEIEGE